MSENPFDMKVTGWCMPSAWIWERTAPVVKFCHGTPHPHAPNHLRSSPTLSTYTPVSLQCTLHKLAQPHHSCGWTKLRSMSNFPRLSPYVSGHCLFVFFSICRICLMHFH